MDFLDRIIAAKRERLAPAMAETPLEDSRALAWEVRNAAKRNRLTNALSDDSKTNIIAEFKRRSPSKGDINAGADAGKMIELYESAGAAAISVLTEEDFFGGSRSDLRQVRAATMLPVLRKDFIVEEFQIYESAAMGADALLLIVAALDDETLSRLRIITEDELGMDALIEVHDELEFKRAIDCGARVIGVNNRNLRTFDVSLSTSESLAALCPDNVMLVSESGLVPANIPGLRALGYHGFLVGETLMRAVDPARALRQFIEAGRSSSRVKIKICGITNVEDARAAIEAGADMLGFNFFRPSPRYVDPEVAHEIIESVRGGREVTMVGVFVNESVETIRGIVNELGLDGIQLHGEDTPEFCEQVRRATGKKIIKAVPGSPALNLETVRDYKVDSIMIDAFDATLRGGTGRTADWTVARMAAEVFPGVMLAGGLSPENVGDAIAAVRPDAVDACSSLESSPGQKDFALMREFVNAVRTSKLRAEPSLSVGREGN